MPDYLAILLLIDVKKPQKNQSTIVNKQYTQKPLKAAYYVFWYSIIKYINWTALLIFID